MPDLVSQSERDSYELELSGLTATEMKALKGRYESDDDPDSGASGGAKGIDLSSKSPMHAAMIKAALSKVERDAMEKAKRVEAARRFRLEVYAGRETPFAPRHGQRYWASPDELLLRARWGPARSRGHTVTDFTRWVHSLYGGGDGNAAAMREGKFIERSIAKFARPLSHPDWELVYHDPLIENEKPKAKPIPALSINGVPIWGAPDVVFRYRPTRELVIVERKASYKPIPVEGWPDLRAQLWCYAQIDDPAWRDAPTIRLVGEVWAQRSDGKLYLRAGDGGLMRWTRGEEPFGSDNAKLWALYKAKIEALGARCCRDVARGGLD